MSGATTPTTTLVMRLPREKIIFTVDFLTINPVNWRNAGLWPIEGRTAIKKVLAIEWDRMIPGHP